MKQRPVAAVPSPCVNVCRMDDTTGWCEGCLRSLSEIAAWGGMGDADKRAVWRLLPERRATRARLQRAAAAAGDSA